jgi:lipoate-protein ligase A
MLGPEHDPTDLSWEEWRLVATGEHDGPTNMAIDEAILLSVSERRSPPTIRFYAWRPPCASIGYAQSMRGAIDLEACRERGYNWVRRPTGGRAVLHIDELTYSVAAPQDNPRVHGDILTSYRRLSRGIAAGLCYLGAEVRQAEGRDARGDESAACFDVPSQYEVTAMGRKLVGSAQVRRRGIVLQHGALPLRGDVARLADVLQLSETSRAALRAKLRARAITVDEVLGRPISWQQVAEALAAGFSEALRLTLVRGDLTAHELATATRLQVHYAGDEWTFSR